MSIKISIIVPVYLVENYIRNCLTSLISQTLNDIEIIVVNDGSPDDSQKIIDEFLILYPKLIRSYIKTNGGLSDARNYGIDRANGEYLSFVDSDDFVDADMYKMMYEKALEEDADVVVCPHSYTDGLRVFRHKFKNIDAFGKSAIESPEILLQANSYAWNKIYRRKFFISNRFYFPLNQWFEDSALIYNVMLKANRVSAINTPLYCYQRERAGSITLGSDERLFDIFKSCDSIINFYKNENAYKSLQEVVEWICVRHIMARFRALSRSNNLKLCFEFADKAFNFLDEKFPNWRKSKYFINRGDFLEWTRNMVWSNEWVFKSVLAIPLSTRSKIINTIKRGSSLNKIVPSLTNHLNLLLSKETKIDKVRKNLQHEGLNVLQSVCNTLDSINVTCFADFGTLLGLVREGYFLKHDIDIDVGVLGDDATSKIVQSELRRAGFNIWRRYFYKENIVQESYYKSGIRVDINYYKNDGVFMKTWLFYRQPKKIYEKNSRNVVELKYQLINETTELMIDGVKIKIPKNPEMLLKEKYGPNWKQPDAGWIYWKSPAAKELPEMGYFITYIDEK